ncbi:PREDICTED: GPI mannosyltransferase 3 [Dinoponera quadriceps]|uniref:Mannosyltransferase n=1 Tax=Dinoponera quadriceps TaxID=609295 RepID=A0A6P3X455_DINQU|nr:PREDICTED: GPI mannosyltransferase 3 [Dinoponera quadriceps]XP_014473073.1 PREDICTED: GPI mannosyltransferase 3 [Dinoponera quadriceps]
MLLPKKLGTLSRLILWRLTAVLLVQTSHVPDEYWQSLEVAHRAAFGYGHLTWEWTTMIRSYTYPFLISILYRILAVFSVDFAWLLMISPRVLQAVLVAYADYRFYQWTKCKWMLLVLCLNWYWYYCATRTLINTVETACTTIALTMFPWKGSHAQSVKFLWIVGFLSMARPTCAIMWLPLCAYHISTSTEKRATLLGRYVAIGCACFVISVLIDSICYGTLVVTPWKFFRVNVLGDIGSVYGTQHALWYIFAGLPVLLGLYCVPFLLAAWRILRHIVHFQRETIMLVAIGWTLTVYSLLPHKEFRFVLPLLPLFIYTSSACTYRLPKVTEFARKTALALLVFSNVMPGLYFSLIHQRGALDAMGLLRDEIARASPTSRPTDTLILTPCHATPLYSHLHVNASVRFLTCEPNLNGVGDYVDEADRFFADPAAWLDVNYVNNSAVPLPTHVIAFDCAASKIARFLRPYKLIAKLFHTHFPESNYGRYVLLYKHATFS